MEGPTDARPAGDAERLAALPAGTRMGKYELLGVLGESWFFITYRARDTHLHREVAIKEYFPSMLAVRHGGTQVRPRSPEVSEDFRRGRDRFLEEARTLALLERTSAVVNVHDFMEVNGTACMVMELVQGEMLEERLRRDGRLPQSAIERLLSPLLEGLEKVHAKGRLHLDIKPSNIRLDEDGLPVLLGFCTTRAAVADRSRDLTAVFTTAYAPLEQVTGESLGPWTDIYALAATLYRCVTGDPPPNALQRLQNDRMTPAAEVGRGRYDAGLLAGIDAGLAVDGAGRPRSVTDWRGVFDSHVDRNPAAPEPSASVVSTGRATAARTATAPGPRSVGRMAPRQGRAAGGTRSSSATPPGLRSSARSWLLWSVPAVLVVALVALFGADLDRPALAVDQQTARIDRIAGPGRQAGFVIIGDVVNSGPKEVAATRLHLTFRDAQDKLVGEQTVRIEIGKVQPNGRARFEVRLEDAPANAAKVDIAVE